MHNLYKPLGAIAARADDDLWGSYFSSGQLKPRAKVNVSIRGGIAIVPLQSIIMRGMAEVGTDPDHFRRAILAAGNNEKVKSILIPTDTPGGEIRGIELAAQAVHEVNKVKPVVAFTNDLNASAGLWITSNAGKLYSTRDGYTGSHGVIRTHWDFSRALEDDGVRVTHIHAGKFKNEGSPFAPLSEESMSYYQERVDFHYREFTAALARGRDKSTEHVIEHFGQGRVLTAAQAAEVGMIDGVYEADQVLAHLVKTSGQKISASVDEEQTQEFLCQIQQQPVEAPEEAEASIERNSQFELCRRKHQLRNRELES